MHLFRSCVWPIASMIAKRMTYSRAGDGKTPSRNILVVGGQRHVKRVVESWLGSVVVVESGE